MNDPQHPNEAADGQSSLPDGLGKNLQETKNLNFTIQAFHYEAVAALLQDESESINLAINLSRTTFRN